MLKRIMAIDPALRPDYEETIFWCALKYALCMDEGLATEAVIMTLAGKLKTMSDQLLSDTPTAVESYIRESTADGDKVFEPEWTEVRGWLYGERGDRMIRKQEEDEG